MNKFNPITVPQTMFQRHREEAVANYLKYEAIQDKIEAMEREAQQDPIYWRSKLKDPDYWEYHDACSDRERYMKIAQLHSTMALMYKPA